MVGNKNFVLWGRFTYKKFTRTNHLDPKKLFVVKFHSYIYKRFNYILSLRHSFLIFFRLIERPIVSLINLIRKTVNYETLYYNFTVENKK